MCEAEAETPYARVFARSGLRETPTLIKSRKSYKGVVGPRRPQPPCIDFRDDHVGPWFCALSQHEYNHFE